MENHKNKMYHSITDILDETVKKYPNKNAFIDGSRCLTYNELQQEAYYIANFLTGLGLFKEPVLIFLDKSVSCVSCFFGVAYSGNFYSIVDTSMPDERLCYIFENLEPAVVITDTKYEKRTWSLVRSSGISSKTIIYNIDENLDRYRADLSGSVINRNRIISTDLVCVLYTSGSTGTSKGVVISHAALIELSASVTMVGSITESTVFANQLPLYFAASLTDIYISVFAGSTTYFMPNFILLSGEKLTKFFKENRINTLSWSATAFSLITENDSIMDCIRGSTIRSVFLWGGDRRYAQ